MSIVTGLRAAAAELGISRRQLQNLIGEGMPITRKSERIHIDVDVARSWLALDADDGPAGRTAPRLHPDDPRFREREISTQLTWKRQAIKAGVFVREVDFRARYRDEIVKVRVALSHCQLEALYDTNPLKAVAPAIARCLEPLTMDDAATWPPVTPTPPTPAETADDDGTSSDFAPMFSKSDPRHSHHTARLARLEIELAELNRTAFPRADVLAEARHSYTEIRKRVLEIPDRVRAQAVNNDPQAVAELLEREVFAALYEISGTTPDAPE